MNEFVLGHLYKEYICHLKTTHNSGKVMLYLITQVLVQNTLGPSLKN